MKCTNENFIKRLKRKKEVAIEFVIDEYLPFVKAIVYKILQPLRKDDLVDDCVSDVFFSVWQNSHQFVGGITEFKSWIGTIAKYKAIDQYRVVEKQQAREQALIAEDQLAADQLIQDQVLKKEEKNELLFAVSKLEAIDRDIFTMKYFLEMSNSEISEALNLSKAAVDNRLYRGKKKLAAVFLKFRTKESWV